MIEESIDGCDYDKSEYLACPYEDLPVLFKYIDKTPVSSARWSNFGKEPPSPEVISERFSNSDNFNDVFGDEKFTPDNDLVQYEFSKKMRDYVQSQREEPIVYRWAKDKQELVDYLRNHMEQCEKCKEFYADFIVDKVLLFEGDNVWEDIAKKDWIYLDIGTSDPKNFMYFSGSLIAKRLNLGSTEEWEREL
jgi:hypothetical protein